MKLRSAIELPFDVDVEGAVVRAVAHRPITAPRAVLLFFHGLRGHRVEHHRLFLNLARHAAERGLAAVRFDHRGSGESDDPDPENHGTLLSHRCQDGIAVYEAVNAALGWQRHAWIPIGLSLGGFVAARWTKKAPSAALVLWSTPCRTRAPVQDGSAVTDGEDLDGVYVDRDSARELDGFDVAAEMRDYSAPVLHVRGSSDESVTARDSAALISARSRNPTQCLVVEGADHAFKGREWTQILYRLTSDFVERVAARESDTADA